MGTLSEQLIKRLPEDERTALGGRIADGLIDELEDYLLKGMVSMLKDISKTDSKAQYESLLKAMRARMAERLRGTIVKIEKFNA